MNIYNNINFEYKIIINKFEVIYINIKYNIMANKCLILIIIIVNILSYYLLLY